MAAIDRPLTLEGWPDDWRNQLCESLPMTNPRIVEGGIGGPLLYSLATACDFASAFNAFGLALK